MSGSRKVTAKEGWIIALLAVCFVGFPILMGYAPVLACQERGGEYHHYRCYEKGEGK